MQLALGPTLRGGFIYDISLYVYSKYDFVLIVIIIIVITIALTLPPPPLRVINLWVI